ncbi:MAG: DUF1697 domain-containing protein [Acidimicrobiales bacterium]
MPKRVTPMVGLLRGVNVGGRNKLPMADLRRIAAGCGFGDVSTYVQSGNVVFTAPEGDTDAAAATLAAAITADTGISPAVTVRTAAELAAIVAANPYVDRTDDPTRLHVIFTVGGAVPDLGWYSPDDYAPEEVAVVDGETYLFLPDGIGRSKLAADVTRRSAKTGGGTARNWRSVLTLADMSAALSA